MIDSLISLQTLVEVKGNRFGAFESESMIISGVERFEFRDNEVQLSAGDAVSVTNAKETLIRGNRIG